MKPIILILLLFLSSLNCSLLAQEKEVVVPYTLADRDRTMRTETKLEALEAKMDLRFEAVNDKFDYLFWLIGLVIALNMFISVIRYGIAEQRYNLLWIKLPRQNSKVPT